LAVLPKTVIDAQDQSTWSDTPQLLRLCVAAADGGDDDDDA